jgi:integrase
VTALSTLWDDAVSDGRLGANIFTGFRFPQQKRAQDQRPMWSRQDLARLFQTPVWAGCKSEGRRSTPGSLVIRDEKFWLPLLAVFTGARQEELCQLHVEDVRHEDGIWLLDINTRGPRRLKNKTAVRLIPLHGELIKIGFPSYVDERRRVGDIRVFPALQPGGADGRLGHAFTKWFTRYRRDVRLYEEGRDFHAFRHSATTFMHQGGVPDTLIDRLTGHATPGETARYMKQSTIQHLHDAIQKIDPGVDLSRLYV